MPPSADAFAKLALERDTYAWLYEELMFKLRTAAAKKMMMSPQLQEQMAQRMADQMAQSNFNPMASSPES